MRPLAKDEYFKGFRPDGFDFHTGKTINYGESIGRTPSDRAHFQGEDIAMIMTVESSLRMIRQQFQTEWEIDRPKLVFKLYKWHLLIFFFETALVISAYYWANAVLSPYPLAKLDSLVLSACITILTGRPSLRSL